MVDENKYDEIKLAILNNIPMPVWACDRDCKIVFWNDAAGRLYGWSAKEAIGKDFVELFVNEPEREKARIDCRDIIDNRCSIRNMADDQDKFGVTRTLVTQCFPIYDVAGHSGLQVEISYEVGDVERLQKELHELQKAYEREKAKEVSLRDELLKSTRKRAMSALGDIAGRKRETIAGHEMKVLEIRALQEVDEKTIAQMELENRHSREKLRVWERRFQEEIIRAEDMEDLEKLIKLIEEQYELDI